MKNHIVSSALFFVLVLASACSSKEDSDTKSSETTAKVQEPAELPAKTPAPKEVEPELTKKKFSEVTDFDLMDILSAKGYKGATVGTLSMAEWTTTTIRSKKGEVPAVVTIVKPSGQEATGEASIKAQSPQKQLETFQALGAAELVKENILIAVSIEGKPDESKELLAFIKNWIIFD